jgi:hypothetical protein
MTESNSIDQTHGSGDPSIPAKRRPELDPRKSATPLAAVRGG